MIYRVRDIMGLMEQLAPQRLAENWDNIGLLAGSANKPVKKILVTLDVTGSVVDEAVRKQADLIISHHPVIFKPIKAVNDESWATSVVMGLLRSDIPVFCAHTNLDKADGGMDDALAERLGLVDVKPLTYAENDPSRPLFGRIGALTEPVTLGSICKESGHPGLCKCDLYRRYKPDHKGGCQLCRRRRGSTAGGCQGWGRPLFNRGNKTS